MSFRRLLSWLFAFVSIVFLASCGGGDSSSGSNQVGEEYSPRIHVLASETGTLTPVDADNQGTSWTLTLQNAESTVLWYNDRPSQDVGSMPLKDYANPDYWRSAYGNVNPNATLLFEEPGSDELSAVYVSLSQRSYDEKTRTVTFNAKLLNGDIDDETRATVALSKATLNVLNNVSDDKPVSSYMQYASQAELQPTDVANQFKVVLSDAGPDMVWVDNAPGLYSDSRPMSYFFPQWPTVFKDSPPNAALIGYTPSGDLKMYFLTLTEPEYDEPAGRVTYTATLLAQTAGAMEPLDNAVLNIDSGVFSRFPLPGKGTAYQAFSQGYDPSSANTTYIYFGSDIARKQAGSLWGSQSYLSQSCAPHCRNDLQTMKDNGINLIRLYDWDPRNDHSQFLDYADSLDIKVVVPISNWLPTQGPDVWDQQVPTYFNNRNFGNKAGTDWHPAVAGVIISNELDADGGPFYSNVVGLVARFIEEADKRGFNKTVPVGVPVTFVPRGAPFASGGQNMPGWNQFDRLVNDPRTAKYKDRLMLCPNTYNDKNYLFSNAEGTGEGWVPLTYKQFGVPILFTEIGYSRAKGDYTPQYVHDQLVGVLDYQKAHPEQVLGAAHFQFSDKVWKQTPGDTDTEGAFGMYHHGAIVLQIPTVRQDYEYQNDDAHGGFGTLSIDALEQTRTYDAVVEAYK